MPCWITDNVLFMM